jgi:UDP-N-acetylglucosamine 4,6-dehydratase/5-epimerase
METLLIIGGTGSLGHTLVKTYIDTYNIIIFSRDENKHWDMKKKFPTITYILGDIRDKNAIERIIFKFKPNIVIIASALKHIDQCENNINECISTNITGIQNVIDIIYISALKGLVNFIDKVLFVSTDKACSPVNSYGMCKSLAERMVIEKSQHVENPKFVVVRYGNVINSRGSLFPLFHEIGKASDKNSFTLTDKRMTRFFMTLEQSVKLIDTALKNGKSGDTYIPKVDSYKIYDIALLFSTKYKKPITISGLRPGEKLHETLINITESYRTIEEEDNYIIKPCYQSVVSNFMLDELNSNTTLSDINIIKQYF